MQKSIYLTIFLCLILVSTVEAKDNWSVDILSGDTFCFKTPLTIKQSGFNDINITAKYHTDSFKQPLYYSVRLAKWHNEKAWEIELIHLKIRLADYYENIQRFEISHGYNLIKLNRLFKRKKALIRVGCGIVISHPENTIRQKELSQQKGICDMGYYISGLAAQFCLERNFSLNKNFVVILEGKLTGSYAKIPVKDGHAHVPVFALHGLIGLRYKFL